MPVDPGAAWLEERSARSGWTDAPEGALDAYDALGRSPFPGTAPSRTRTPLRAMALRLGLSSEMDLAFVRVTVPKNTKHEGSMSLVSHTAYDPAFVANVKAFRSGRGFKAWYEKVDRSWEIRLWDDEVDAFLDMLSATFGTVVVRSGPTCRVARARERSPEDGSADVRDGWPGARLLACIPVHPDPSPVTAASLVSAATLAHKDMVAVDIFTDVGGVPGYVPVRQELATSQAGLDTDFAFLMLRTQGPKGDHTLMSYNVTARMVDRTCREGSVGSGQLTRIFDRTYRTHGSPWGSHPDAARGPLVREVRPFQETLDAFMLAAMPEVAPIALVGEGLHTPVTGFDTGGMRTPSGGARLLLVDARLRGGPERRGTVRIVPSSILTDGDATPGDLVAYLVGHDLEGIVPFNRHLGLYRLATHLSVRAVLEGIGARAGMRRIDLVPRLPILDPAAALDEVRLCVATPILDSAMRSRLAKARLQVDQIPYAVMEVVEENLALIERMVSLTEEWTTYLRWESANRRNGMRDV